MDSANPLPFTFKIEKDGDEHHAWCPELTGCHTHGKTPHLAFENLKDAVQLYLDTSSKGISITDET